MTKKKSRIVIWGTTHEELINGTAKYEDCHDVALSNLQTFPFSCCKRCPYPEPTCHDTCGKYQWERDEKIRQKERNKIVDIIIKEMYKIDESDIRWYGFNSAINLIESIKVKL